MAFGKPKLNITISDLYNRVSEIDILAYFLDLEKIPCAIKSPFREDKHPSFRIFSPDGFKVYWYDFATQEKGGLFDLFMKLWHCSFVECLHIFYNNVISNHKISLNNSKSHIQHITYGYCNIKIECKTREWKDYDIEYWNSYGITLDWLKWADVYPISHKIITKNNEKFIFGAEKLAYAFVEHKEGITSIKIYQPLSKTFKWMSGFKDNVISLWSKIPQTGDKLIICSSLKDALCISCQLGIPTLAPQGEGYALSETAINNLKERYSKIFISFDTDEPGILNTKRIAEETGFTPIIPDLKESKDYSDYYKSLTNKEDFKQLKTLFI